VIRFVRATPDNVRQIDAQIEQFGERDFYDHNLERLLANAFAITCLINDHPVASGGFEPLWEGRGALWGLFGRDCGPALPAIAKQVRFFLASCPVNRLELTVRESFGAGCRLAALLGLNAEARLLGFFPDGSTAVLYSRVLRS